ncbi:MAG: imidazole glycerol phosphate synthase subunit HisH, partial [Vicingus serpentipes]|nr:imidazole glycerol phosphate synthase subunit HisH [Vicingus serpentipes]
SSMGVDIVTTNKELDIQKADKSILPGVGHFSSAIENLQRLDIIKTLNEEVLEKKKPILGICLGMQLFASASEEGDAKGLGWIDATVERLQVRDSLKYKIPHTGWNQIEIAKSSDLLKNIDNLAEFYFVHSYHFNCKKQEDVLCLTAYETQFVSAVERNNIYGTQFHPEKSHGAGVQLLKNFIEL